MEVKPRPIPLLTKVSKPGEPPVYKPTVRPLPLSEISGGTRKVPRLEDAQGVPFLRIGKPQSHAHANFLKHKGLRRQLRITAFQNIWEERRHEAAEEDMWESTLEELADREGVVIPDVGDETGITRMRNNKDNKGPREVEVGPFEWTMREFGANYLSAQLRAEIVDMQARTTAMLDLRDEEQRLADMEKREKKERRRAAWEQRVRQEKALGSADDGASDDHSTRTQPSTGEQQDARDPFESISRDAWVEEAIGQKRNDQRGRK